MLYIFLNFNFFLLNDPPTGSFHSSLTAKLKYISWCVLLDHLFWINVFLFEVFLSCSYLMYPLSFSTGWDTHCPIDIPKILSLVWIWFLNEKCIHKVCITAKIISFTSKLFPLCSLWKFIISSLIYFSPSMAINFVWYYSCILSYLLPCFQSDLEVTYYLVPSSFPYLTHVIAFLNGNITKITNFKRNLFWFKHPIKKCLSKLQCG